MARKLIYFIPFIILLFLVPGEKVAYNDGAGWDGNTYREVALTFLDNPHLDAYLLQRILPFATLNISYNLFGIPLSNGNLMLGILILNVLALLLGMLWYFQFAAHLKLTIQTKLFGYVLLFFSFPILKITWYEPWVTDLFAFVLGIGMVNFYIQKKRTLLFILSLIGGFVWPTLWLTGLILFFFPRKTSLQKASERHFGPAEVLLGILAINIFSLAYLAYSSRVDKDVYEWLRNSVSLLAVMLYFFYAKKWSRWSLRENLQRFLREMELKNLMFFLISITVFYIGIQVMASGIPTHTSGAFILQLLIRPLQYPFNFLVNHYLYFGLVIPLAICYGKSLFKEVSELGMAFTTVFVLFLIFALNSEARMIINYIPFLLLPLLLVLNKIQFSDKFVYLCTVVNLILSKFWYTINVSGIAEAFETYDTEVYLNFPAQRYFQHFGPWQHPTLYLVYGLTLLLSLIFFKWHKSNHVNKTINLAAST